MTHEEKTDLYLKNLKAICRRAAIRVPPGWEMEDWQSQCCAHVWSVMDKYNPERARMTTWIWAVVLNLWRGECAKSNRRPLTCTLDPTVEGAKLTPPSAEFGETMAIRLDVAAAVRRLRTAAQRKAAHSLLRGDRLVDLAAASGLSRQAHHNQRVLITDKLRRRLAAYRTTAE